MQSPSPPRPVRHALALAIVAAALPALGAAQSPDAKHEHTTFRCRENGLANGQASGCQLLARPRFPALGKTPVFWHLTTYATRGGAEAARRAGDTVVEVDGRFWLTWLGPRGDTLTPGSRIASIGPLQLPADTTHQMDLYYVIMPARARTVVHVHPGPEAWYILEGEQCLETPLGAARAKAGEGSLAPPGGTPMQLSNTGSGTRRAVFIVVHDPSVPMSTLSDWRPKGLCSFPR